MKRTLFSVGAFSAVINLLALTTPLYVLLIFDKVLPSASAPNLVTLTAVFCVFLLAFGALDGVRGMLLAYMGFSADRSLAHDALTLQTEALHGGAPVEALDHLKRVRELFSSEGLPALFDAVWIPVFLLVLLAIHPLLAVLCTVIALILAALVALSRNAVIKSDGQGGQIRLASARSLRTLGSDHEQLRMLGLLPAVKEQWLQSRHAETAQTLALGNRLARIGAAIKTIRAVSQIAIYATGAWLALERQISPGAIIAASIIAGRALAPVELLGRHWSTVARGISSWRILRKVHEQRRPDTAPGRMSHDVPVELASCTTPLGRTKQPILRGVTLTVNKGEMVGIVGNSASGKTTLLRLIGGVVKPLTGHVRLFGSDPANLSAAELGLLIGYLPEKPQFQTGTVAQNISRFDADAAIERVAALAKLVGINGAIEDLPDSYATEIISNENSLFSAAELRLLALARALYGNPPLLLLDHPESELDPTGFLALNRALAACRQAGQTVLVATHNLPLLQQVDRIAVLDKGALVMLTKHEFFSQFRPAATNALEGAAGSHPGGGFPARGNPGVGR